MTLHDVTETELSPFQQVKPAFVSSTLWQNAQQATSVLEHTHRNRLTLLEQESVNKGDVFFTGDRDAILFLTDIHTRSAQLNLASSDHAGYALQLNADKRIFITPVSDLLESKMWFTDVVKRIGDGPIRTCSGSIALRDDLCPLNEIALNTSSNIPLRNIETLLTLSTSSVERYRKLLLTLSPHGEIEDFTFCEDAPEAVSPENVLLHVNSVSDPGVQRFDVAGGVLRPTLATDNFYCSLVVASYISNAQSMVDVMEVIEDRDAQYYFREQPSLRKK